MHKWKNWQVPAPSKSYKLHLMVKDLNGLPLALGNSRNYLSLQIEWKKPSTATWHFLKRGVERCCTSKKCIQSDGTIIWNERFDHDCNLKLMDSKHFQSSFINFEVHQAVSGESTSKTSLLAKTKVDIGKFAAPVQDINDTISIPVKCSIQGTKVEAMLKVALTFSEMQSKRSKNSVHPCSQSLLLPSLSSCIRLQPRSIKGDQNPKARVLKDDIADVRFASNCSTGSATSGSLWDEELEFSYMSLASASLFQVNVLWSTIQYDTKNYMDELQSSTDQFDELQSSNVQFEQKPALVRVTSWNKRKMSFKGLYHPRDAPLLNKTYGEEGGDDIDNERRCHFSTLQLRQTHPDINSLAFGFPSSDRFEVGSWEKRKLESRDGKLELVTEVFLATIDQRSEKAAGSGACTVLAAVIADWLHQNPQNLPLKCEFDNLIREGSSEWRNLCENEAHKRKFSDQHFDLETVLQAKLRPLSVISEKSFVGFFVPECMHENLEFLEGAMSFDNIWEELQSCIAPVNERVYIVSWNDHFFVLKVEVDAIYMIDTLGERLFEGCTYAYIAKFSKESKLYRIKQKQNKKNQSKGIDPCPKSEKIEVTGEASGEIICEGITTCKEFIKSFLADLPLRDLQADIEKGMTGEAPLHHRLQIDFHYTLSCTRNSNKNMETLQ